MIQKLRRALLPLLGRLVAEVNDDLGTDFYVTARTDSNEYVGVVPLSEAETERVLREMGAVKNPVAAWKRLRGTKEHEQASYAFRGHWDGKEFVHDKWGDYQLHVILYELDEEAGTTAVYAHYEYSWLTHPVKHYRGRHVDGNGSKMLRSMLRGRGIEIRPQR